MTPDSNQWHTCDGTGQTETGTSSGGTTRRTLLQTGIAAATVAALAAWTGQRSALAQVALNPREKEAPRDILVNIFLRGAADCLSLVVPYGEDEYYKARPTLAIAAPKKGNSGAALDLNGFFGLHPALAPLHPLFQDGKLAIVHAVGSGDQTRSHFEAMATMERGEFKEAGREARGWLARHLDSMPPINGTASPLRAVALGTVMPDTLRGATDATAVNSLDDFRLAAPRPELETALRSLYGMGGKDAATLAGHETLAVLETLRRIDPAHYKATGGVTYPKTGLGDGLRQTACLIKARVGLEAAFLDRGGWDTHVGQGGATGWLALQLDDVAKSLAAFAQDLGKDADRVTVVVQTEFGRRVQENTSLGTDHGRAGAMFLWGGGVNGGKVYSDWPGLKPDQLEPPGDLRVTTDYRDVLGEVLAKRLGNQAGLAQVFPGANISPARFKGIVREG